MIRVSNLRGLAVVVALAGAAVLGTASGPAQEREGSPELAALVPKLADWTPSEAARSYFPESLFEYIDGAAESYLSYDFRELLVVDLEKKGTEATLTLELYDMGTPRNAFGIFGAERYPDNSPVSFGNLGYMEGEALNFMAGRFYVKLLAFGLGDGTAAALTDIGSKVAGAVKDKGALPALVRAFPPQGLVAQSEKYIKKNFMGYEFLHDGYTATYRTGGGEFEGFAIEGGSEEAAEGMLAKLVETLAAAGQAPEKSGAVYHARNRYGEHLYVGRVGRVLVGAMRVPDGLEKEARAVCEGLTAAVTKRSSPG